MQDPVGQVELVLGTEGVIVLPHQPAVDVDERAVLRGARAGARSADLQRQRLIDRPVVQPEARAVPADPRGQSAGGPRVRQRHGPPAEVRVPGQVPAGARAVQAARVERTADGVLEVLAALQAPGHRRRGALKRGAEQPPRILLSVGRQRRARVGAVLVVARALHEHRDDVPGAAQRGGRERERLLCGLGPRGVGPRKTPLSHTENAPWLPSPAVRVMPDASPEKWPRYQMNPWWKP